MRMIPKNKRWILLCGAAIVGLFVSQPAFAQQATLEGQVLDSETREPIYGAIIALAESNWNVETDEQGRFSLPRIPYGDYELIVFALGKNTSRQPVSVDQPLLKLDLYLEDLSKNLDIVTVQAAREKAFGITRLRAVEDVAIYEGKKSEVVVLDAITANLATNNPRQVFARVTGLNIWESDGAGLQLGIGGRGLSPNRTSNFNTRQNGYDISADALGYPESYYTPPAEALERIEVVRGAASLQYGTQFGGMLNFVFKKPATKPLSVVSRQTLGSFNFFGSFNSLSGTLKNGKMAYSAFYQHKQGDGWRPNSKFELNNGYAALQYRPSDHWRIGAELTVMNYLAQQPGGLTDALFEQDARQSIRSRNWFQVKWHLMALTLDYTLSDYTKLNIRNFGLLARRQSLGNLAPVNNIDFGGNRDLIDGTFENVGSEARLLHRYRTGLQEHTLLLGMRFYRGFTTARQGEANDGSDPDFYFLQPEDVEKSDYRFPNYNWAAFAEHIFYLSPKFTLTPGIRWEQISTFAEGYYKQRVFDAAGNLIVENRIEENTDRKRDLWLLGLGLSYKLNDRLEWYGNISQNYRAINFSDLRIDNPNSRVDSNIMDERGFTADLGLRSKVEDWFYLDVTAFYIHYQDRIGLLLRADEPPLYNDYRLRTNIADARNMGIEAFAEWNFWHWLAPDDTVTRFTIFLNTAFIDARYINTSDNSIRNKKVELVAPVTIRSGLSWNRGAWRANATIAYTAQHFTDATNAVRTASAVNGIIPAYTVVDLSAGWRWRWLSLELSGNNLLDARYFTRRADAYPGPGIIPADGRSVFVTVGVAW
ncbi:MAG TPA: TonB-dependent receptor [Saprospiraceae bacterium]|nr:TonB-dependent receptor [Saprospiraceae bacterium]HMQ84397.1 TonB-dependent receptor [Saprospiraceae bacterium]